jgi:hypothetical protein
LANSDCVSAERARARRIRDRNCNMAVSFASTVKNR